jgi:prepilin-type N-terminal cleavage/methylation domain-containing protein
MYRGDAGGFSLMELIVALVVLGVALAVLTSVLLDARRLTREADRAGDAMRLAESQIEALRATPPARRPRGTDLPALVGAEALDHLPGGRCALSVEPFRESADAAPLLRVRVRVAWEGECGPRETSLCTVVGAED